jgi:hypothetical protein
LLDRLISGAGAVTDAADRVVRALGRGGGGSLIGSRPGSLIVAGICFALAAILALAGLEATDDPTARSLTADQAAFDDDLGARAYATVTGSLISDHVETYTDDNGNGAQDEGERGLSWFYFVVDPVTKSGITVRSTMPPETLYRFEAAGMVRDDVEYVAEDVKAFAEEASARGFTLAPSRYLDSTIAVAEDTPVVDLVDGIPTADTWVRLEASRTAAYLGVCSTDTDDDGDCDAGDIDLWDVVMFDPGTGNAITVVVDEEPAYTPVTFTGMIRRDERTVSEAKTTDDLALREAGFVVSDRYLLEAGSTPASAPLAFALALLSGLLGGVILIGFAGRYLIFRRSGEPLPPPATTLGIGERLPARVTGVLRTPSGTVHVREAPADLVRFPLSTDPGDATSTLILERRGRPEGVALGLGELERLSSGAVMPLHGPRPAIRVMAGTGPLLLSFESAPDRDRAAAELLDETGLTIGTGGIARA